MKTNLRVWLTALSAFILHFSYAQVTLVSDNTNLESGFVLPNGVPLLISSDNHLYTTNGTTATLLTNDVTGDTTSGIVFNNQFYFGGANTSNDVELWVTNGTTAGTHLVQNISAAGSSAPDNFFVLNNRLYFTADDGVHGRELWSSDGSVNGATLVSDINGTATGSIADDANFFQNGSTVFFPATNTGKLGLYKVTSGGISLVKENLGGDILLSPLLYAAALGNKVVFTVQTSGFLGSGQLWATDGTLSGTLLLKDFGVGSASFFFPTPVLFNNAIYFTYIDIFSSNSSLWKTDGTAGNTVSVRSFGVNSDDFSTVTLLDAAVFNNRLYFTAYDSTYGNEMWSTAGDSASTTLLKDINPDANSSNPFFLLDEGALVKAVNSGTSLSNFSFSQFHTVYNGKLYFTADDGTHGTELWSTDGTANNTSLVKDINTGGDGLDGSLLLAYYTSNGIYFSADDGASGDEPWLTNGTDGGTNRVADINTNATEGSNPSYLFIYNNQLYLNASNGGASTDLYKINQSVTALPVSLLSFAAAKQSQSVLLSWTTANEVNTSRFTVERSIDGAHFSEAGTVAALNNNAVNNNYQFTDMSALQTGSSVLYYRLKTTDKDGTYSYSSVLKVQLQNGVFTFTLSPNPVRNQLTVSFSAGNAAHTTLRVTDANGRQLFQQVYASSQTAVQQNINVSKFLSGIYFIQLITDKETKALKFVKE